MLDWFAHRIFTLRSLGRLYGRRGYPRPDTFVALPLYELNPPAEKAHVRQPEADSSFETIHTIHQAEGAAQ